jgi:hypothetical protein
VRGNEFIKYIMEISECKTPFGRPGHRRIDRTVRIDFTVGDLMKKCGLHCLGIANRIRTVVMTLRKLKAFKLFSMGYADYSSEPQNSACYVVC